MGRFRILRVCKVQTPLKLGCRSDFGAIQIHSAGFAEYMQCFKSAFQCIFERNTARSMRIQNDGELQSVLAGSSSNPSSLITIPSQPVL